MGWEGGKESDEEGSRPGRMSHMCIAERNRLRQADSAHVFKTAKCLVILESGGMKQAKWGQVTVGD